MPVQDFLITFKADTSGALANINALNQRVQQITAAMNKTTAPANVNNKQMYGQVFDLQQRLKQGRFTDVSAQLRTARQLENALFRLAQRGEPVAAALAKARREVDRLAAAASNAKSVKGLLRERTRLEGQLERTRLRGGDDRDLLRSAMRNERELMGFANNRGAMGKFDNFKKQFDALPPAINRSTESMIRFNASLQQRVLMGERLNLPQLSPAALTRGLDNGINLMQQGFKEGGDAVEFFGQRVQALPPTLSNLAQGMLNHGRRVAEGLFIYEALGRAMSAVGDQITLINNLAREQIRFSAVSGGLGAGGNNKFLSGLQDIAVRTNTPMDELAAQIDTVGAAMINNGDAAVRMADSQQFLNDVGQFTNITQRDLASETENLLGIYSMAEDSVGGFSDRLGRIVLAGRNSSKIISGVTDVISEAGRSARATGFDFDFLASVGGQMVQDLIGTMSGSEIGGMLNTIIGRLTDPDVIDNIQDLTKGVIAFSNADGTLRNTHDILIDIFQGIESGVISAEAAPRVLDQIVPPLNPGARAFVAALQRNIPEALADMDRIAGGSAENAKALSDALVSGPGERFAASMKDVSAALTGIFTDEVISAGNTFAGMLTTLANILGAGESGGGIGGSILSLITRLGIFAAGVGIVSFAWRNLSAMLFAGQRRMEAIRTAVFAATGMTDLNSGALQRNAGAAKLSAADQARWALSAEASTIAATRATTSIFTLRGAYAALQGTLAGVLGVAKGLLPVLIAMAAFELPGQISDAFAAGDIQSSAAPKRSRFSEQDLERALSAVTGPTGAINEFLLTNVIDSPTGLSKNQRQNILEVAKALVQLEKQGKLTAESQKAIEEQVVSATGVIKEEVISADSLVASMDLMIDATGTGKGEWDAYTAALADAEEQMNALTSAEERAAQALIINAGLSDVRAAAMMRLNEQLRSGEITVDEWSEGQSNAAKASESAAAFIAAYGDQLALIPGLQERIAQTGEPAAEALMGMLMDNPDTINERIGLLDYMVELADTQADLAEQAENNPVVYSIETEKFLMDAGAVKTTFEWLTTGTYILKQELDRNKIEPQIAVEKLRAQAAAALKIYQVMLQASASFHKSTSSAMQAANPEVGQALRARVRSQGGDMQALERAIAELDRAAGSLGSAGDELAAAGAGFGIAGGIFGDDPRLGSDSDREPSQTGIIDIGDLPASAISQIIAIAEAAQSRVVAAGGVVDDDETAAFFKDAAFQRLVSGVDQRFLQQAIEELTEVEKRRLELEQQRLQDVTRSTVVQTGPIQSIVSAPVLAAGGGVLTGQGLNADPRLGNFTINVPINWSGMDLATLQRFIYESVSKAYIDAARGG